MTEAGWGWGVRQSTRERKERQKEKSRSHQLGIKYGVKNHLVRLQLKDEYHSGKF